MATIGCDLASIDDDGDPDWEGAVSQGHLRFVGLRAAEGLTPDPTYQPYRRQLDRLGVPSFPYLRLVPGLATPERQVDAALVAAGSPDQRHFPIAIDVEGRRGELSAPTWRDWVVRANERVCTVLGTLSLVYTSATYWADPDGMGGLPAPELADTLGWWKYWPYHQHTHAVYDPRAIDQLRAPPAPGPWGDQWGIHQYQGDALGYPGFRNTVDLNQLHVLRPGDRGGTVRWIQRRLPDLTPDGVFGPLTEQAVKNFQTACGITADGIVGLDTLQRLSWVMPV